ncbi:Actin-related protein 4 [Diatrype stigma]|uniref:Actin-related protein 4 n=1 Tax=Diatrype stigma TaxID=117547 RepID=A0AAN9UI63_9PEZI
MASQPLSNNQAPMDVYGGDEVSALVLDAGYCHTRAGFAGEDVPKSVLPSFYGNIKSANTDSTTTSYRRLFGDDCLVPRADGEIKNYMSRSDGIVEDWDAAIEMWEHMLIKRLQPEKQTDPSRNGLNDDPVADGEGDVAMDDGAAATIEDAEKPLAENPLLMTEPPWNPTKAREKSIELAMESWGCPAFWLSRTPVCAAFAAGKATALVVDVGGAGTSVTAVHDGMILKRSVQRSAIGGLWLSSQIRHMWDGADPKVDVVPTFLVESKNPVDAGAPAQAKLRKFPWEIAPSFRAYEEERLLTEFKESVVEVWRGPGRFLNPGNEDLVRSQPGRVFEMPDGSNRMWREERFRVSEGLWDENAALSGAAAAASAATEGSNGGGGGAGSNGNAGEKVQTIPELIRAALNAVDQDVRPNLLGNIVVTGGSSLLNGFNDRLNNELIAMYPAMKIKLHAAGLTTERRFGAWIGGSILASLGTFHQMWISKQEYDENGVGIVEKRCK